MTPEQATIIGAVIQAVATIAIGILVFWAGIYVGRQQHNRRNKIKYSVATTNLVNGNKLVDNPLPISIDKETLTGISADKGILVPIMNATEFVIQLKNIGNEAVDKPIVEIKLDKDAAVVNIDTLPVTRQGYIVDKHRDPLLLNSIRVTPDYISSNDTFVIKVISVENKTLDCNVNVLGRDIKLEKIVKDETVIQLPLTILLFLILGLIIAIILNSIYNIYLGSNVINP